MALADSHPPHAPARTVPADLTHLARLLDARFQVLGVRFGLDPLLGLVPVAGDLLTSAAGLWILVRALALGAPGAVVGKMGLNLLLDAGLGAIPGLGDLADVGFKANLRNVRLLEAWLARPSAAHRRSRLALWAWGAGLGAAVLGVAVLAGAVSLALLRALSQG